MTEIVASQTPPILHGPSEKEKRYDRQLRLWAASGQAALESAHIVLVNSGSGTVGVEALKNLVLPGIGKFTILDNANVTEADLGVNFFLEEASLGKPRGQCCADLLLELNPDVAGHSLQHGDHVGLDKFLKTTPQITLIMYSLPIQPRTLEVLEVYGKKHMTPLVAIHSAGLYSYFRVSLPGTFPIVDTHPDETATTDLRVLKPWPELEAFAEDMTENIDELDNHDHGHLPYVVLLLYFLKQWRSAHDGKNPTTFPEKVAFRKIVTNAARTDTPEGGEENFDEAVAAVMKTLVQPGLPVSLQEVFDHKHESSAEQRSSFWLISDAIKTFYERHGCLPVTGKVSDMKAQSKTYIALQNVYKTKARQDTAEVVEIAKQLHSGKEVDVDEVELFCKNAAFVKLINAQPAGPGRLASVLAEELLNDENAEMTMMPMSLLPIYLALSATAHNPTASATEIIQQVSSTLPKLSESERLRQAAEEVARAQGGELHNISAVTGGMVAQELIKIITKQYIPVDNICVFDGITSRTQVIRL